MASRLRRKIASTFSAYGRASGVASGTVVGSIKNLPPVWVTGNPFTAYRVSGQWGTYQLSATDPEGQAITYSAGSPALPAGWVLPSNGLLQIPPSTAAGRYFFGANASDGVSVTSFIFTVDVADNTAPAWTTAAAISITQGTTTYQIVATDPDAGQTVTYALQGGSSLPSGWSLSSSGLLTLPSNAVAQQYPSFVVEASDGFVAVPRTFTVTVSEASTGTLIPAAKLYDWSRAGVPGGIPNRTTIYTTLAAGSTGAQIMSAINACPANQVVQLAAGTFPVSATMAFANKSNVTLRGAGRGQTILSVTGSRAYNIVIGNTSANWPQDGYTGPALTVGAAKGDFVVTLASTSTFAVGDKVALTVTDDPQVPVMTVDGLGRAKAFRTRVEAKTATTLTLLDPLPFAMPLTRAPNVHVITDGFSTLVGIEDLTIDCSPGSIVYGVCRWNTDSCWLRNVEIKQASNYDLFDVNAIHNETRDCFLNSIKGNSTNGSGFLNQHSSNGLFENNVIYFTFPHLEQNFGVSACVFAYNFCIDNGVSGVTQGASIDTNHGAHNAMNLFEGNISPQYCADGYFGSVSDDVAFRNRFHGTNEGGTYSGSNGSHCVELNRFTRNYTLVENVLGATQAYWTSKGGGTLVYNPGEAAAEPCVYLFGYPNLGNTGYSGTAQLSAGDPWSNWSAWPGGSPSGGAAGFQELDRDVALTTLLKRNYNAVSNGIHADEQQTSTEPASLYKTSKPSWFGSLAWPAFGTGGSTSFGVGGLASDANGDFKNKIPAAYRFYNGTNP